MVAGATCRGEEIVLPGRHYWLRTLRPGDVTDRYVGWLRDPDVTRFLEVAPFTLASRESVGAFVASFDNRTSYLFGIFARDADEHVGNISLRTDPHHRLGWHGTVIGDKRYWGRDAAIEAHQSVIDFAFERLDLRKLYAGVFVRHTAAIFNLRRLGYTEEMRLKGHFLLDGEPVDCAHYALFRETWLGRRAGAQA